MIDALSGLAFLLMALAICAFAGLEVSRARGRVFLASCFGALGLGLVISALSCIVAGALLEAGGYMIGPSAFYL